MCGIIAGVSLDGHDVNEEVYYQFQDQSARGTRGFGMAMLDKPEKEGEKPFIHVRRSTDEIGAVCDLKLFPTSLILFHHRTPTSSDNKIQQTHPILVSNECLVYDWLICHNGMINNADEMKKAHEKLGFKYSTDDGTNIKNYNDSECIATDLALLFEREHIKKEFGFEKDKIEAKGSAAIIGLQLSKETHEPVCLFYGRNAGNPLKVFRDQRIIFISSEGKGEIVKPGEFTIVDLTHKNLKQKTYDLTIPYYYQGFDRSNSSASLPIRHSSHTTPQADSSKVWPDEKEVNGESCTVQLDKDEDFANEFNFISDPTMMEAADKMYDELEVMAHQFIETICNKDGIEFSDQYITDMRMKMEEYQEKMQDFWEADQEEVIDLEETDKVVAEAARDGKVQILEGLKDEVKPTADDGVEGAPPAGA